MPSPVSWSVTSPSQWTNSSAYQTSYADNYDLTPIPTGQYTVVFSSVSGYTKPANITTNITGASPVVNSITGTYTLAPASAYTLTMDLQPFEAVNAGAMWMVDNDGIWRLTGASKSLSTNTSHTLRYKAVLDFYSPPDESIALTSDTILTRNYRPYTNELTVVVSGLVAGAKATWSITSPSAFINNSSAYRAAYTNSWFLSPIPTGSYTLVFNPVSGYVTPPDITTNIVGAMAPTVTVTYAFIDITSTNDTNGNDLPDNWEMKWFGHLTNNPYANPDGDFIPSTSTNPPTSVSVDASSGLVAISGPGGSVPGYPLQRDALLKHGKVELPTNGMELGYSKGVPFTTLLECKGLDGYYLTNGPNGTWVPDDDPKTDPTEFDTQNAEGGADTKVSDGWKYYFWYWRADNGLPNSANLSWVNFWRTSGGIFMDEGQMSYDRDDVSDSDEYSYTWTDPTHADTDGDGMDDWWEVNICGGNSNALDNVNGLLNPDGDFYAVASNRFVLTTGTRGTAFPSNTVCYSTNAGSTAANPLGVWVNIYTNTGSNVFDLYHDTIVKAAVALANGQTGGIYTNTVFYGTNTGLGGFKQGYPVWVDMNGNSSYDAGDVAIVNPPLKHEAVYLMAPAHPFPGLTSFDPRTAWTNTVKGVEFDEDTGEETLINVNAPNSSPYTTYQEYLSGDYFGRLSWDADGRAALFHNDYPDYDPKTPDVFRRRTSYTLPENQDTDGDLIPDGWELYVGMNPNDGTDAQSDGDGEKLFNFEEWANATHPLGTCGGPGGSWTNKIWPSDPGVLVAPSPNDPHPTDTDWDGLRDNAEQANKSNPTGWDTDKDAMPDGWEVFYGANVTNVDARLDYDGDGLSNIQEYWTGTVDEWQYCDARWGLNFRTRERMGWDISHAGLLWFIPPDYLTCPSFLYLNGIYTDVDWLRINYPANNLLALDAGSYHTTRANDHDSDRDGMDDYWEVYHGLNPLQGYESLAFPNWIRLGDPYSMREWHYWIGNHSWDADPNTPGFQFGLDNAPFNSAAAYFAHMRPAGYNPWEIFQRLNLIAGPFNFGMDMMDPDGDNLPNLEEYSYDSGRAFYHTDPTPFWRTDENDPNSFVNLNYGTDYGVPLFREFEKYPFDFEMTEGFDTDNDGKGDYAEINAAAGESGDDPRDSRNPIRNRALYVNGTDDFVRSLRSWYIVSSSVLSKFCVEAWVKPDDSTRKGDFVIVEKAGLYRNPYNPATRIQAANFRLGITNGLAYIRYNGRGALRAYQATAKESSRQANNWFHVAGTYDGAELTIYVNGEASATLHTTELPATGYNAVPDAGSPQSIVIGASDLTPGTFIPDTVVVCANFFGGCIDEVRVWDGPRTQAQISETKNQRLSWSDMTNSAIQHYYSFDDVPDPQHRNSAGILDEPVAPNGLLDLDTTMSFHQPVTWWATYPLRSTMYYGLNGAYNYIVSAEDHAQHRALVPPLDDFYHFSTNYNPGSTDVVVPPNYLPITSNPYNRFYINGQNWITDLYFFKGARGVATNSWLDGLDPTNPDSTDTDGDGLPDWWEQKYGLNPNDAAGENGAWGDFDGDGLNNRAEYLAGTDPRNSDTYGTGVGDYDYPRGVYSRTYGEMFTDGDGMPDLWEMANGLDPQKYDANLDKDGDGWSNYQEFIGGTDPQDARFKPNPAISGIIRYDDTTLTSTPVVVVAYQTNTMDGLPQATAVNRPGQIVAYSDEQIGWTDGTLTFSGVLPGAPIPLGTVVKIKTEGAYDNGERNWWWGWYGWTEFVCSNSVTAGGTNYIFNHYHSWDTANASGHGLVIDYKTGVFTLTYPTLFYPLSGNGVLASYSYQKFDFYEYNISGVKEGNLWLLAFKDENGSGIWEANEPLGVAKNQPVWVNASSPRGPEINLERTINGYPRFSWPVANNTLTAGVQVVINKTSQSGAPQVVGRTMRLPRNMFMEYDYQLAGIFGLAAGAYQWWVGAQNGTFSVNWPASMAKPTLDYPRGDSYFYARGELQWQMSRYATKYHLQIFRQTANGGRVAVVDDYYPVTGRETLAGGDQTAGYRAWLPKYTSEMGNGVYYWRLSGWNPAGESEWSDYQTFQIDLSTTHSRWINGDIYYYGKVPCDNIIIEAFNNPTFSGEPESRVLLTPAQTSASFKTSFSLAGMRPGFYYVRAFIDTTPAANSRDNVYNYWESVGFVKNPYGSVYLPRQMGLVDAFFFTGAKIVMRDHDTDNDKLPDAWEMAYFGNLDQTGDMDYDGDGESNLDEYIKDGVNQNPASWDSDGDGLADGLETSYNGNAFGFTRSAKQVGAKLNPSVWDTDGDNYSDGAELFRYHTDPLNPNDYPPYSPLCFSARPSPGDYDDPAGDGRSDVAVYDSKSGVLSLATMSGQSWNIPFGFKGAQPMVGDFDGDGRTDFSFYDKGLWNIYFTLSASFGSGVFGDASMTPVPGDYDGDGRTDVAVYDTDSGDWYIYYMGSGALASIPFGAPGMIPVPGDYNGDGAADVAVYEPATGNWMIGCYHKYYKTWTTFGGTLGGPTWTPVPGDYDGDGRTDICLFESKTGRWMLYALAGQFWQGTFGWKGCVPAPGDYDGDGRTDLAIYDKNTGMWYIYCISGDYYEGRFGGPGALPILKGR
ncbi:MAG: LamG-like jellyroll fold domain-containing protein [Kiritimatiellia bacterium]